LCADPNSNPDCRANRDTCANSDAYTNGNKRTNGYRNCNTHSYTCEYANAHNPANSHAWHWLNQDFCGWRIDGVCSRRRIPDGSSDMDKMANDDEKSHHTVYLDAFWIDKYEVTNALYKKCVDAGKCTAPSERKSFTRDS